MSRFKVVLPASFWLSLATAIRSAARFFAPSPASLTALSVIWMPSRTIRSAVSPLVLMLLFLLPYDFSVFLMRLPELRGHLRYIGLYPAA